jgi:hypothetical protein
MKYRKSGRTIRSDHHALASREPIRF